MRVEQGMEHNPLTSVYPDAQALHKVLLVHVLQPTGHARHEIAVTL